MYKMHTYTVLCGIVKDFGGKSAKDVDSNENSANFKSKRKHWFALLGIFNEIFYIFSTHDWPRWMKCVPRPCITVNVQTLCKGNIIFLYEKLFFKKNGVHLKEEEKVG